MADSALAKELGRELRRVRLAAGFATKADLAEVMRIDRSVLSRAETGARVPTDSVLSRWCAACRVDGSRLISLAHAARGVASSWLEGWRDIEQRSVRLGYWSPIIVAPVCRTEDYIRAVLGASGTAPGESQVADQVARAAALERAEVTAVLHELALRRFVGSPVVMAAQMRYLARLAGLPSVHICVVLNDQTVPGMSGSLNIAHDLGVVHMEGMRGRTASDPEVFRDGAVLFDRVRARALPREISREVVLKEAQRWESMT